MLFNDKLRTTFSWWSDIIVLCKYELPCVCGIILVCGMCGMCVWHVCHVCVVCVCGIIGIILVRVCGIIPGKKLAAAAAGQPTTF